MSPEIQFLSSKSMLGYGTTEMRCIQPAQFLREKGWHCETAGIHEAPPRATRLLVLHRVQDDQLTRGAIAIARAKGVPVVYDVDDLIFDADGTDHLQSLAPGSRTKQDPTVSFRRAMELCDLVSASTTYLKDRIEAFHPACHVMPNGLSRALMERAATHRASSSNQQVTLAYYSGSAHHDADFALIQPALKKLLQSEPTTRLMIVGKLKYDSDLEQFGERFEYRLFLPYDAFIGSLAEADINLVPLVTSSAFAQARSELKYIESGAFGVPTVASPTQTYVEAIRDGQTGILCKDGDWFETLRRLVQNPDWRVSLGRSAREHVSRRYGPEAMEQRWNSFVHQTGVPSRPDQNRLKPGFLMARQQYLITRRRARIYMRAKG